ncbi:ATP-dependent Clp protease adaptor protein ClpS [Balneicella halophila]|uniref:ATP-dependent Clp protease adaptor protein ClpS n=1 Tax=Balneicella halophila TaxID=1537566 RepID=A0A7L4URL7_BALHA|nr:ATP-dependent Clp protease adaptor ClpS [Balneicella halophila]PVX51867.1 ATP-dependent Clp protease adaptor protein ClpS [Balneicella halophila]
MGESTRKQPESTSETTEAKGRSLILHNDDFNDFDFVVDTLIVVCEHEYEQAFQCALITHHKGKCEVKRGSLEELKPLKHRIIDRGINATID